MLAMAYDSLSSSSSIDVALPVVLLAKGYHVLGVGVAAAGLA
jgi:hypothetical protein